MCILPHSLFHPSKASPNVVLDLVKPEVRITLKHTATQASRALIRWPKTIHVDKIVAGDEESVAEATSTVARVREAKITARHVVEVRNLAGHSRRKTNTTN